MFKQSEITKDIIQSIKELKLVKKWKLKANPVSDLFTKSK